MLEQPWDGVEDTAKDVTVFFKQTSPKTERRDNLCHLVTYPIPVNTLKRATSEEWQNWKGTPPALHMDPSSVPVWAY